MRDLRPTAIKPALNKGKSFKGSDVIVGTKRFDETIVDGFSVISFKLWEDLQDHESNERAIKDAIAIDNGDGKEALRKSKSQRNRGKRSSPNKINSKIDKVLDGSATPTTKTTAEHVSKKVTIKSEKGSKDKRNKTSSEKITIEEALKATELAEKRLSILQEELKKEQFRNLNHETERNIPKDYHVQVDSFNGEPNSARVQPKFDHNLIKDSSPPYKPLLHSPNQPAHLLVGSNHQVHQTLSSPLTTSNSLQDQFLTPQQQNFKPAPHHQYEHSSFHPHQIHQAYLQQYNNQLAQPPLPYPNLLHQQQHNHQLNLQPYSTQSLTSSMMGMSSLPPTFGFPSPICVTDTTISRQTSIIPPSLSSNRMEYPMAPASSKITQSNVSHSLTPYNHAMPMHHSMYYPSLPTERSFIQFTRSYTGPGANMGYHSNLVGTLQPTGSHMPSNIAANQYPFNLWPREAADGAVYPPAYPSMQNNLAQCPTTLPGRSYTEYTSTRLP